MEVAIHTEVVSPQKNKEEERIIELSNGNRIRVKICPMCETPKTSPCGQCGKCGYGFS